MSTSPRVCRRHASNRAIALGIVVGVLFALILALASVGRMPESTKRMFAQSELRQLGIAMYLYDHDYGHLPPAAICNKHGTPVLSWRVALLPYIEQEALYKTFHLDEPWDSPHNIQLLKYMPKDYRPQGEVDSEPYTTFTQVFVGKGTPFERGLKISLKDIAKADGLANTVIIVEAGEAVPWTKPTDLEFDSTQALPKLGGVFPGRTKWYQGIDRKAGIHVVLADNATRFLPRDRFNEDVFRPAMTWNDGKVIDLGRISD